MIGRTSAVGDHRPDVGDHLGDDLALAARATDRTRPQRRGDHPGALAEQLADVEFTLHAALHPDDDQPAVGGEGVDVAVEVGLAPMMSRITSAPPSLRTRSTKSSSR